MRDWYANVSATATRRFQRSVDATFDQIAAAPQHMAMLFDDLELRTWKVPRFPHMILYRIEGDFVVIEALRHGAGDPERWRTLARGD